MLLQSRCDVLFFLFAMKAPSKIFFLLTHALVILLPQLGRADETPSRIACVGDSITYGSMIPDHNQVYPVQLQKILGSGYQVENDGAPARTVSNRGDYPYQKDQALQNALKFLPNIVVIMLGGNDVRPPNVFKPDEFIADYKQLIDKFKALGSHPHIFVCLPIPAVGVGNYGIHESGVQAEIPLIKTVAHDENIDLIDLHGALQGHDSDYIDRIHPNGEGARIMAEAVAKAVTTK